MSERYFQLKCKDCGGNLLYDPDKGQIASCPYCKSTNVVVESDKVAVEKIRANLVRDLFAGRNEAKLEEQKESNRDTVRVMLWIFLGIPAGIGAAVVVFKLLGYIIRAL